MIYATLGLLCALVVGLVGYLDWRDYKRSERETLIEEAKNAPLVEQTYEDWYRQYRTDAHGYREHEAFIDELIHEKGMCWEGEKNGS